MKATILEGFPTEEDLRREAALLREPEGGDQWILREGPDSVVIGKNQNLWQEVAAAQVFQRRIPLFRRVSGGGAVFHTKGNLIFTHLFHSTRLLDFEALLAPIIEAFLPLGIRLERRNCSDLFLPDGRKVSGNAVARRGDWWLHHGTLLVAADMGYRHLLGNSLGPHLRSRAVPSRPSPVGNLSDRIPGLTVGSAMQAILDYLQPEIVETVPLTHSGNRPLPSHPPSPDFDWLLGNSLPYSFETDLGEAGGHFRLHCRKGRFESLQVLQNSTPETRRLAELIPGTWHHPEAIVELAIRSGLSAPLALALTFPQSAPSYPLSG
ncbi:MAG: biotin/lipoate A/B protein ligase family protein [Puniceicoccaceae bacterium]